MKHEIEIEGLPEGFEVKEVLLIECESNDNDQRIYGAQVIVKKKQPRRIVLEETGEENHRYASGTYATYSVSRSMLIGGTKMKWREVNETAPSLHNADDKESLRLSVDECKTILTNSSELRTKINKFVKDK